MANEQVSAAALEALLGSDAPGAVLDVRERGEFALRQIPGTSPLARGTLEYRAWAVVPTRRLPMQSARCRLPRRARRRCRSPRK